MATERKLERDISRIYQSAGKDMTGVGKKWRKYFKEAAKELKGKEEEFQKAKESGDKKEIARLERELRDEKQKITTGNAEYRKIVSETTDKLADANQNALSYINEEIPSYYTESYNTEMKAEAVDLGFRYDMADEATVKRLITDGDIDLPKKKLDIAADKRWNTKYINSQVTQGIVLGESMDKIADRIFPEIMAKSDTKGLSSQEMSELLRRNRNAAIRNARTLVNGAENRGRQDRYRTLAKLGAVMKRIWIATGDERTRDLHLDMDGQEVDLDEPFVDGNRNELDYPGDPHAAPETVYNCRCTTKARIVGVRRADGSIVRVDYDPTTELHKEQIQAEIKRRQEEEKAINSKEESKEIAVGNKFDHKTYGAGTITEVQGNTVTIDFNGEEKKFASEFLEKMRAESNPIAPKKSQEELTIESMNNLGLSQAKLKKAYDKYGDNQFTPEARYEMAMMMSTETASKDNFYMNSVGYWQKTDDRKEKADYISYRRGTTDVSSEYWYTDEGVYRRSDHWGSDVASCSWYIEGREYSSFGIEKGSRETAFIKWEDLKAKGVISEKKGVYSTGGLEDSFKFI